jgi:glycosyltransferase involved in cell wall biosynthesis
LDALARIRGHATFLMVGTVEPRKAHAQVVAAFDRMWQGGSDACLVIVGKQGWMVDDLAARLRTHPGRGSCLFWFEAASDELLDMLYGSATALIAASRGEGFGLPIVEAARRGVPVIARDIPVFREVAGDHAAYFQDDTPVALADTLAAWMAAHSSGNAPDPNGLAVVDWSTSAAALNELITASAWQMAWDANHGQEGQGTRP